MLRTIGLNHDLSRPLSPSRPARRLGQKLKGPLRTAVVAVIQGQVSRQDSHQRHSRKIMSLHNHLGSHQNIRILFGKLCQDFFIAVLFPCGVRIHPEHPGTGKPPVELLLDLLGSRLKAQNIGRRAGGTLSRLLRLIAAVMTHHFSPRMLGQGHVAVRTFHHAAAAAAGDKARIAPAVEKEYDLLPSLQALIHQLLELLTENGAVPISQLLPQIHRVNQGQRPPRKPPVEGKQLIPAAHRPVIGFQGRCRGAQNQAGSFKLRQIFRGLPCMVTGHGLALVAALMLLVHDDQSQIGKRNKKSRSRADNHIYFSPSCPLALIITLPLRERGVDHRHPVSEPFVKTQKRLIGQGDLRNQHDTLLALGRNRLDQGKIDLCLSAARDSPDQISASYPRIIFREDPVPDKGLLRAHPVSDLRGAVQLYRIPVAALRLDSDYVLLFQLS